MTQIPIFGVRRSCALRIELLSFLANTDFSIFHKVKMFSSAAGFLVIIAGCFINSVVYGATPSELEIGSSTRLTENAGALAGKKSVNCKIKLIVDETLKEKRGISQVLMVTENISNDYIDICIRDSKQSLAFTGTFRVLTYDENGDLIDSGVPLIQMGVTGLSPNSWKRIPPRGVTKNVIYMTEWKASAPKPQKRFVQVLLLDGFSSSNPFSEYYLNNNFEIDFSAKKNGESIFTESDWFRKYGKKQKEILRSNVVEVTFP